MRDRKTPTSKPSSADYHLHSEPSESYEVYFYDEEYGQEYYYPYLSPAVRATLDRTESNKSLSEHDKIIIQRLAMRSFHLPGNTFWEDWNAFLCNNHPVFGLTSLADPRHPFGLRERLINLIASLAFGLAATSMVILWYYHHNYDMNELIFRIGSEGGMHVDVTHGLVALLVFGGALHVAFDFGIWFLQACPPCREGGLCTKYMSDMGLKIWLWLGAHLALEVTLISLILASYVIVLRAGVNDVEAHDDDAYVLEDDHISRIRQTGIEDYAFVAAYFIEVIVSQFVLFPIVAFTIFSGVLGCGRIPFIGGRPWQKKRWDQRQERLKAKARQLDKPVRKKSTDSTSIGIEV